MNIVMFDLEQMNHIFQVGNNHTTNCMRELDPYILYRIEEDTEAYCNLEDKDQILQIIRQYAEELDLYKQFTDPITFQRESEWDDIYFEDADEILDGNDIWNRCFELLIRRQDQVQDRDSFLRVFKQSFQEGIQKAILRETQRRKRDIMERHNSMMEETKTRKFIWEPN